MIVGRVNQWTGKRCRSSCHAGWLSSCGADSKLLQGAADKAAKLKLRVESSAQRDSLVFRGAAILAHIMQDSSDFWTTAQAWQEDPWRAAKGGQMLRTAAQPVAV